jgi:hypothetical protein
MGAADFACFIHPPSHAWRGKKISENSKKALSKT